jgi:heptose I phosphotransferase
MSASFWQRLCRGTAIHEQRSDWPQYVGEDWPEQIMDVAVTDRFHAKQGRSTGRWILRGPRGPLSVYLKRHYRLPRWRGLLATVWPAHGWSPALEEWRHLEWARGGGLPVPEAVAAGEYIGPWGGLRSFLAVEELVGMLPLHEAIPAAARQLPAPIFRRWKESLVTELAGLVRRLHAQRRFHKDLYLCHFYIPAFLTEQHAGWDWQLHMIDLHRLGHHPVTWPVWQIKDLGKLLYSSELSGVDEFDRLQFWQAYAGESAQGWAGRLWRWCISFKARGYRRHNRRAQARRAARAAA